MSYAQQVKNLAKSLGAVIENGSGGGVWQYNIDAPQGYTWCSDHGLHSIVAWCYKGDRKWTEEMWKDALDRMEYGIEPCETKDCEFCSDENWN